MISNSNSNFDTYFRLKSFILKFSNFQSITKWISERWINERYYSRPYSSLSLLVSVYLWRKFIFKIIANQNEHIRWRYCTNFLERLRTVECNSILFSFIWYEWNLISNKVKHFFLSKYLENFIFSNNTTYIIIIWVRM